MRRGPNWLRDSSSRLPFGGQLLTENVAILSWIADRDPKLAPTGEMGCTRLIEMLVFLSTELHKAFARLFFPTSDAEKTAAENAIRKWLSFLAAGLPGDYLFGDQFSVADAYLYVMLRWARMQGMDIPEPLPAFFERMNTRPAVRLALQHEELA